MGDFNADNACNNRDYEEIMRQRRFGEMKDSGELLTDLCTLNRPYFLITKLNLKLKRN